MGIDYEINYYYQPWLIEIKTTNFARAVMKMNKYQRKQECYQAIKNAYTSLQAKNLPRSWAVGVGAEIYKFHYPNCIMEVAVKNATSLFVNGHEWSANDLN